MVPGNKSRKEGEASPEEGTAEESADQEISAGKEVDQETSEVTLMDEKQVKAAESKNPGIAIGTDGLADAEEERCLSPSWTTVKSSSRKAVKATAGKAKAAPERTISISNALHALCRGNDTDEEDKTGPAKEGTAEAPKPAPKKKSGAKKKGSGSGAVSKSGQQDDIDSQIDSIVPNQSEEPKQEPKPIKEPFPQDLEAIVSKVKKSAEPLRRDLFTSSLNDAESMKKACETAEMPPQTTRRPGRGKIMHLCDKLRKAVPSESGNNASSDGVAPGSAATPGVWAPTPRVRGSLINFELVETVLREFCKVLEQSKAPALDVAYALELGAYDIVLELCLWVQPFVCFPQKNRWRKDLTNIMVDCLKWIAVANRQLVTRVYSLLTARVLVLADTLLHVLDVVVNQRVLNCQPPVPYNS